MSKTISQIAKEIGVTRQAVWYKTKNKQVAEQIKKHSEVIGKTICIDEEGEKIIINAFLEDEKANTNQKNSQDERNEQNIIDCNKQKGDNYNPQIIDILNFQIANLNKQNEELRQEHKELKQDYKKLVEELRSERKHLLDLTDKLAQLAANAQKLHAGDIVVPKLEVTTETDNKTKKPNIFNLLFKHKKEQL